MTIGPIDSVVSERYDGHGTKTGGRLFVLNINTERQAVPLKSTCLIIVRQVLLFGCHLDSILLLDKEVNQSDDFKPVFERSCFFMSDEIRSARIRP